MCRHEKNINYCIPVAAETRTYTLLSGIMGTCIRFSSSINSLTLKIISRTSLVMFLGILYNIYSIMLNINKIITSRHQWPIVKFCNQCCQVIINLQDICKTRTKDCTYISLTGMFTKTRYAIRQRLTFKVYCLFLGM